MNKFTVTLNFFLPQQLVETLRQVQISQVSEFDWRESGLYHCTIKEMLTCNGIPDILMMKEMIANLETTLRDQPPFSVIVRQISSFPNVLYANVFSDQLVQLHNKLCARIPGLHPDFEGSNFIPHVTFAILGEEIESGRIRAMHFGSYDVRELQLVIWNQKELDKPVIAHKFRLIPNDNH